MWRDTVCEGGGTVCVWTVKFSVLIKGWMSKLSAYSVMSKMDDRLVLTFLRFLNVFSSVSLSRGILHLKFTLLVFIESPSPVVFIGCYFHFCFFLIMCSSWVYRDTEDEDVSEASVIQLRHEINVVI